MGLNGGKVPSTKPIVPDHSFPTLNILVVIYACVCVCVCMYIHMYVCIQACMYVYIYIYIYIYMYIIAYLFIYWNYGSFHNGVRYTVQ